MVYMFSIKTIFGFKPLKQTNYLKNSGISLEQLEQVVY
jgi:hypothetical protein